MLATIVSAGMATAQDLIFKETFGTEKVSKIKIGAFTGYDNKDVTFEGVSATDGDIRSTSNMDNHIWLPSGKDAGIIIKGINTAGATDLVLSFDATVNADAQPLLLTVKANGTTVAYPETTIALQNVYQNIVCIDKLPEGETLDLEISATAANNTKGYRLDNIMILGKKSTPSVPTLTVPESYAFPTVRVGQTSEQTINVSALGLTGDLTVSVTGEGFASAVNTISKEEALLGTTLTLTFAPTEAKDYTGEVTISGGGLAVAGVVALSGKGMDLSGAGTLESPYTVADVIALNNAAKGPFVVKGYIVGAAASGDKSEFTAPFTINTSLYIGMDINERDITKLVPVQLPSGDIRAALNLVDHPENLGKVLTITGELVAYFNQPGIKTPTAFTLDIDTDEPAVVLPAEVSFPWVAPGIGSMQEIAVKGVNLTGDLTVALDGEGFNTGVTTLTKADAEAGTTINVFFAPQALGDYTGTLTISGGGLTENAVAALTAKCLPLVGDGTAENPFTVADVIAMNNTNKGPYFVKAVIVGAPVFEKPTEFAAPFTTATALYIGDAVTERDTVNLVPVQLTTKPVDVRTDLSLMDHPDNLGKVLTIKGELSAYFGQPGIKNPSEFTLTATSISSVEAVNRVVSAGGNLVVNSDQAGTIEVYNTFGQKVRAVVVKEGYNEVTGLPAGQVYIVRFAGQTHKVVL